jgi:hypothetical protein
MIAKHEILQNATIGIKFYAVAAYEFEAAIRVRSCGNPANEVQVARLCVFRNGQCPVGADRQYVGDHTKIEIWVGDVSDRPWPVTDNIIINYLANGWKEREARLRPEGSETLNRPSSCRMRYCELSHGVISVFLILVQLLLPPLITDAAPLLLRASDGRAALNSLENGQAITSWVMSSTLRLTFGLLVRSAI